MMPRKAPGISREDGYAQASIQHVIPAGFPILDGKVQLQEMSEQGISEEEVDRSVVVLHTLVKRVLGAGRVHARAVTLYP